MSKCYIESVVSQEAPKRRKIRVLFSPGGLTVNAEKEGKWTLGSGVSFEYERAARGLRPVEVAEGVADITAPDITVTFKGDTATVFVRIPAGVEIGDFKEILEPATPAGSVPLATTLPQTPCPGASPDAPPVPAVGTTGG